MKKIIFLASVLFISVSMYGQGKTFSVEELVWHGLSMNHLDSIYKNGLPVSDPNHQVFSQNYYDNVVEKARIALLQKMGDYFEKNGLKWGNSVKCWNRIYFNSNGTIDYFVYHFIGKVDNNKENEFKKLLNRFNNDNKFPVVAKGKVFFVWFGYMDRLI
jgi:hypothetical protein